MVGAIDEDELPRDPDVFASPAHQGLDGKRHGAAAQ